MIVKAPCQSVQGRWDQGKEVREGHSDGEQGVRGGGDMRRNAERQTAWTCRGAENAVLFSKAQDQG